MRTILLTPLLTPPIQCLVPARVFDAFAWCRSVQLDWTGAQALTRRRVTVDNPPRTMFVFKRELSFLPRELAGLHVPGLGLIDEWGLAPYAIDEATDELYARAVAPRDALFLATDSSPGLFWGLHDWAHFHNHGPFTERAWTELQCDASALAWLWLNRSTVGIDPTEWNEMHLDVQAISAKRFTDEGLDPAAAWLDPEVLKKLPAR